MAERESVSKPAMTHYNMHKIKRLAHREAWYGDSPNPFRRTRTGFGATRDIENQDGSRDVTRISSEPPFRSGSFNNQEINAGGSSSAAPYSPSDPEKIEVNDGVENEGRTQSSDKTVVDSQSGRRVSQEQTARQRFISRFSRHKDDSEKSATTTGLTETKSTKSRKHKFTVGSQLKATIFNSWINLLLVAAPVGIALHFVNGISPVAIFVINFIAIVPLAAMLSFATEEISLRVGETLGGLLNATFGNAVELIVSVIALTQHEYVIVKTSLVGSMLSNLLLVMGMCFFFGGLRRTEQFFNITVAQTAASLLALAIASVIVPTAFDIWTITDVAPIAAISRATAVILLVVYGCYLYFQLKTHATMYNEESQKVAMRPRKHAVAKGGVFKSLAAAGGIAAAQGHPVDSDATGADGFMQQSAYEDGQRDQVDEPQLHIWVAVFTLGAATAIIALCAEFMVSSIGDITSGPNSGVSAEFVGLILLPIVGNAAEHATAVTVAVKDKMDLAIGVAVGSSMQIALLVLPLIIVLGWILGLDDMNLSFDGFQVAVLFVAVLLVNYLIADGKSHWLEGVLLQCLYLIIAVAAWYYPHGSLG